MHTLTFLPLVPSVRDGDVPHLLGPARRPSMLYCTGLRALGWGIPVVRAGPVSVIARAGRFKNGGMSDLAPSGSPSWPVLPVAAALLLKQRRTAEISTNWVYRAQDLSGHTDR